jgi:long-chain acyl-CoA synthetase
MQVEVARPQAEGPLYPHTDYDAWASLPAAFLDMVGRDPDAPMLAERAPDGWLSRTRGEVAREVRGLAAGLQQLGVTPGDRVVLVSGNRPAFLIAELAIMAIGAIAVPAYTTNTEDDHAHVLRDSGAVLAIAATQALASVVARAAARCESCRALVQIDAARQADVAAEGCGLSTHAWPDVAARGHAGPDVVDAAVGRIGRDDTACLLYTSGTGGVPKGVMLSHGNLLANCKMAHGRLNRLGLDDTVALSFLPPAHAFEHTIGQFFAMTLGARIHYSRGLEQLGEDFREVGPTLLGCVPRLLESIHHRIRTRMQQAPPPQRLAFEKALELGRKRHRHPGALSAGERLQDALLDRTVRRKVRERFGGRIKAVMSAGAALDPEVGAFFTALGVPVLQGYGQTEAAPAVACNPPHQPKLDTVGPPLAGVTARLAEDGELLVRGPMVMQGYWGLPDHTAATLQDGWLYTGDIAEIDADGYIRITDRKKDIVVLSGGDRLAPARVEAALTRQPEIAQAMVHGDERPHLIAILVPDDAWLAEWAAARGHAADLADLADNDDLVASLRAAVDRANESLSPVERVRAITVAPEAFSLEKGLLTPTMKTRRHKVVEAFGERLERLYRDPK